MKGMERENLCGRSYRNEVRNHFVGLAKMVERPFQLSGYFFMRSPSIAQSYCFSTSFTIDLWQRCGYILSHIRPLAVRPLNYPESVPNPWGFSFSTRRCRAARGETKQ